jgi:membrane protease YdiL (CAAX protease family)
MTAEQDCWVAPPTTSETVPPVSSGHTLPEDIRVPWGWIDILIFVALYLGSLALCGLIVWLGFSAVGIKLEQLRASNYYTGLSTLIAQGLQSILVLGYFAAQMHFQFGAPVWRTLGWRSLEPSAGHHGSPYLRYIFVGLALSVVVELASSTVQTKNQLPIEKLFQDKANAILLMVMAVALAPIVEETIFRGYLYPVIARSFGVGPGIVITGTLFGSVHAIQLWGGWVQIALIIFVGIIFTYVRSHARSVLASYLVHVSYNAFPLILFLAVTRGFHRIPVGP